MTLVKKDFLITVRAFEMLMALIPRFYKWKKTVAPLKKSLKIIERKLITYSSNKMKPQLNASKKTDYS